MRKMNVKMMAKLSIIAALYVAITLMLQPLSYGAIQFRISETLMLLVMYNPYYSVSLTIGCLIANIASSLGAIDILFGTLATLISCVIMTKIKNIFVGSLIPAIVNAIIIGLELYFVFDIPLWLGAIQVFIGEFVVCTLIGIPLFRSLEGNEGFIKTLGIKPIFNKSKLYDIFDSKTSILLSIAVIGIVMFFNLGLNKNNETVLYSLAKSNYLIFLVLLIPFINVFISKIFKPLFGMILLILINIFMCTYLLVQLNNVTSWYFYIYYLIFILPIVVLIYDFIKHKK